MSAETDKLLYHDEVATVVRAVLLSTGLRGHTLEDEIQNVFLEAWKTSAGNRPTAIDGWKRLCRRIAKTNGIDLLRKRKTIAREQHYVGPTDQADEHPSQLDYRPRWEEHDANKALKVLWAMMDEGLLPVNFDAFLDASQAGAPQEHVARAAGISLQAYRTMLWTGRQKLIRRMVSGGLGALAVAGAAYALYAYETTPVAHHDRGAHVPDAAPSAIPSALPPSIPVTTGPTPAQQALKASAEAATKARHWETCVGLYKELDTEMPGWNDAGTDESRSECERGFVHSLEVKKRPQDK